MGIGKWKKRFENLVQVYADQKIEQREQYFEMLDNIRALCNPDEDPMRYHMVKFYYDFIFGMADSILMGSRKETLDGIISKHEKSEEILDKDTCSSEYWYK